MAYSKGQKTENTWAVALVARPMPVSDIPLLFVHRVEHFKILEDFFTITTHTNFALFYSANLPRPIFL